MTVPFIALMGGKVVQLVQGREKELEGDDALEMLRRFGLPPLKSVARDSPKG